MSVRPLVVIPTKDNHGTIAQVVVDCLEIVPDVLVVDDGCVDGSGELAADAGATVVRHPVNRGKGHAILTALAWARDHGYTHTITIDADGQHLPGDLPVFLEAIETHPRAVVVGVRHMPDAPGASLFGRRFSNFWVWVETGVHVGDSQSGFRAYPVVETLELGMRGGRYELEVEVLSRALWANIPVIDVPIRVYYPDPSERVSSFDPLRDNLRITLANTRLVLARLLVPSRWASRAPIQPGWSSSHRGTRLGWTIYVEMLRRFGRWPVYLFMLPTSLWFVLFAPEARESLDGWFQRVRPQAGPLARLYLVWRTFFEFALAIVDRFLLLIEGPAGFEFESEGIQEVVTEIGPGNGMILVASHLGNADLGAAAMAGRHQGFKVAVLRYAGDGDPEVELARDLAPGRAPRIIPLNNDTGMAAIEAMRALRGGEALALKADRLVDDRVIGVPFFGKTAWLPAGPFYLAGLSKAPVVFFAAFKVSARRYRVLATPPRTWTFTRREGRDEDVARWAREYAAWLEDQARSYPTQWFNFYDLWDPIAARNQVPERR